MKLNRLFIALAAGLFAFVACEKEGATSLDSIQLDKTYLSIPAEGGDATLTINAKEAWAFAKDVVIGKDDDKKDIKSELPTWLTASTLSGEAGETKVTFHADAIDGGREQELHILVGEGDNQKTQYLLVRQGSLAPVKATCEEVIAGADGKTFTVTGIVTDIYNTKYGNWWLVDDTGKICIYGTLDKDGKTENFTSLGIENGDKITVQGPKTTYVSSSGDVTIELVDVTVIQLEKSLIKLDTESVEIDKKGGEFTVKAAYKGNGVFVTNSVDWVVLSSMDYIEGVPTKIQPNPADTAVITFKVGANTDASRNCEVSFASGSSSAVVTVNQAAGFSAFPLPYEETFLTGKGGWETVDIVPVEGVASIWTQSNQYGMVAKATKAVVSQAELVSPNIDLSSVSSAVLSFEHVQRFAGNVNSELKLFVSKDNGENWTEVLIPYYSSGKNWNYVLSGEISLKPFAGNLIKLKFQYSSTLDNYSTWEIKNLKVVEGEANITSIAELNNSTVSTETSWSGTFTNAVVTYVNGNNAFIEDATGGNLLYLKNHGFVAGQVINGSVSGKVKLYNGFSEMTTLDVSAATVTDGEAPAPKVITLAALLNSYLRWQNCQVKLEAVTFDTALTTSVRSGKISQNGATIAAYAQIKNTIEMSGTGDLICWPSRNNATLQLGCWDNSHFTPAE